MYKLDKQDMTLKMQAKDKIVLISAYRQRLSGGISVSLDIPKDMVVKKIERLTNEKYSILFMKHGGNFRLDIIGETEYLEQFVNDYDKFLSGEL